MRRIDPINFRNVICEAGRETSQQIAPPRAQLVGSWRGASEGAAPAVWSPLDQPS